MTDTVIRHLSLEELQQAMKWTNAEGWQPGSHDAEVYHTYDPTGFLGLFVSGDMLGVISVVHHTSSFAFIGLFIVKHECRGQGYGKQLWSAAMRQAENVTSAGLFAVPAQISRYRAAGFRATESGMRRWQAPSPLPAEDINHITSVSMVSVSDVPSSVIKFLDYGQNIWDGYDESLFADRRVTRSISGNKRQRRAFLHKQLAIEGTLACLSYGEDGSVTGIAVVRKTFDDCYRVGPLHAQDPESVQRLTRVIFSALGAMRAVAETVIMFDIPSTAVAWNFAEYFHLTSTEFTVTPMFKGKEVDITDQGRMYAVHNLEMGL